MTLHVTKLNNAINIGDRIPMTQEHGNIGRYIEYSIKRKGYALNRGKGIDLKGLHLEIKTRLADSTSGHTVGAMLPTDIVETEWENSNIHDKVQKQYRVEYKDDSPWTGILYGEDGNISVKIVNGEQQYPTLKQ